MENNALTGAVRNAYVAIAFEAHLSFLSRKRPGRRALLFVETDCSGMDRRWRVAHKVELLGPASSEEAADFSLAAGAGCASEEAGVAAAISLQEAAVGGSSWVAGEGCAWEVEGAAEASSLEEAVGSS